MLSPQITKYVINTVEVHLNAVQGIANNEVITRSTYDPILQYVITLLNTISSFGHVVIWCGIVLIILALLRGLFTFLMRQTIIVMSRYIEYAQKNDVYAHYQTLDTTFYKKNSTGDLMNRISEDVSRVRMFTGPAVMYSINLIVLIGLSVYYMYYTSPMLMLYTLAPLPILAFIIYKVNIIINTKSEQQQEQLSTITSMAQESYSGIRVIKSYLQEANVYHAFNKQATTYKDKAIDLARTEAWYFPSITLLIGVSTLLTIMIGGLYKIAGNPAITIGVIAEFVVYINMLTFPVSSIGWVASIIQRASASQKRINEFLLQQPTITTSGTLDVNHTAPTITYNNVSYTYTNTGIQALKHITFTIQPTQKIAIVGRTGSGKTTLIQLLQQLYQPTSGTILWNTVSYEQYKLIELRKKISYVPQEVFLFSDTVRNNIQFGVHSATATQVDNAAKAACVYIEIMKFDNGMDTVIGERGVTLSGGQKQRISIARALLKEADLYIFDDCLSAVDVHTELAILQALNTALQHKAAIFVTHRIYNQMQFDNILVLDQGSIVEQGTHDSLMQLKGLYYAMYMEQQRS